MAFCILTWTHVRYMDIPTLQNIDKEIVWGHEMMECILLLMPLAFV